MEAWTADSHAEDTLAILFELKIVCPLNLKLMSLDIKL